MKVRELLTRDLTAIESDTTIEELVQLLQASGLSGLPVVDAEGHVIGFISERDVIEAALPSYFEALSGHDAGSGLSCFSRKYQQIKHKKVAELMTRAALTVTEDDEGVTVADLMIRKGLKVVPVLDRTGRLAGVVRRIDLLRHCFSGLGESGSKSRE